MARIAGVDLPRDKRIEIACSYSILIFSDATKSILLKKITGQEPRNCMHFPIFRREKPKKSGKDICLEDMGRFPILENWNGKAGKQQEGT